jgi:predicted helicase
MSEKEKGDVFEHLVRAYLLLDPEYATKLRKVWLLNEVPSALRKKLRLPSDDQGIDLIAETNTGEFWAIQCKYREDTSRPLAWREISTFTGLAFGVCQHISFGLVCSTTERFTRVLKDQDRIGFCSLDVWQSLDQEFFSRLRQFLGHKPAKLIPLKPRPHQKTAITTKPTTVLLKNTGQTKRAGSRAKQLEKALDVADDFAVVVRNKDAQRGGRLVFQETVGDLCHEWKGGQV